MTPKRTQSDPKVIPKSVDPRSECLERLRKGGTPLPAGPLRRPTAQKSRGAAAKPRSRTAFPARACKNLVPKRGSLQGSIWDHLGYLGFGFEVFGPGFEVLGLGFEVSGPGFKVSRLPPETFARSGASRARFERPGASQARFGLDLRFWSLPGSI